MADLPKSIRLGSLTAFGPRFGKLSKKQQQQDFVRFQCVSEKFNTAREKSGTFVIDADDNEYQRMISEARNTQEINCTSRPQKITGIAQSVAACTPIRVDKATQ